MYALPEYWYVRKWVIVLRLRVALWKVVWVGVELLRLGWAFGKG